MTRREWFIVLLLAGLGYGAVAVFFQRYDTSARWHFAQDRQALSAKAQAFAAQQGIDTTKWVSALTMERSRNVERYLATRSAAPLSGLETSLLTPIKTRIEFLPPDRQGKVTFLFAPDGQLLEFSRTGLAATGTKQGAVAPRQFAENILQQTLGEKSQQFSFSAEAAPEKDSKKFFWSYTSPQDRELKITAEVLVANNQLIGWKSKESLPPAFQEEITRRNLPAFALIGATKLIINVLCVLVALVLFFLGLTRKEIDKSSTLKFLAVVTGLSLLFFYLSGLPDDFASGTFGNIKNRLFLTYVPYLLFFLFSLSFALLLTAFWSSGEAVSARYRTGREAIFSTLMRGKLFARPIAINLLIGVLVGGFIAALPLMIAWAARLRTIPVEMVTADDLLIRRFPALTAGLESVLTNQQNSYYLLMLFGMLAPMFGAYLRSNWLRQSLIFIVGIIFLLDLNPNQTTSLWLKFFTTAAILLTYWWLYRRFDLLAVITASTASGLLLKGAAFLAQPSTTIFRAGLLCLLSLGVFALLALVLTKISPDEIIEQRTIAHPTEDEGERDRLKASFEVARRAQEKMLPDAAPEIPGLSIAALCRPARECGGDLYDFIEMADGKLGVVVADVSGKGVPAALYMTLTKGLLKSVAEESNDPGEILKSVNKHLYEVCKRKMFVTLFFAVLDPLTKTLTYARAGHNPPVLRQISEQHTRLLKPAGIGLGLNAGKSFDRVLRVEQIQLHSDDALILYSDGITEAMNEQQEEYGEERLMKVAEDSDGLQAEATLNAVIADVSFFLGTTPPQDDQTLVVIRVK